MRTHVPHAGRWIVVSAGRGYPDADKATIAPLTEERVAERFARGGTRVVLARGRFWREMAPGVYGSVHDLSRSSPAEAKRPRTACWGYRTTLNDEAASHATGRLPIHLITDAHNYDVARLPARTRRELRQFERNDVRLVHLNDPWILREQGYEVMLSWIRRTRHRAPEPQATYYATVERIVRDPAHVVLAGIRGNQLLGYSVSWVIDGSAHIKFFVISSQALPLHLSTALWFETAQFFRRNGLAKEISAGLAMPEREGLTDYKNRLGFKLVYLPSAVWLLPGLSTLIRRRYPYKYYRFTGIDPRQSAQVDTDPQGRSSLTEANDQR